VAESYVAELAPAEGAVDGDAPAAEAAPAPVTAPEPVVVDTGWTNPNDRDARDLLLEIGVEEMPASACRAAIDLLPERVSGLFTAEGVDIAPDKVHVMVSPRRIAVLVKDVPGAQALREITQRGPAFEAAFDADGNPTKACEGFARAKGFTANDLQVREEGGRRFVYYVTQSESRATSALLPEICLKIVRDMYFPKNMRWEERNVRFSRPIRWLVALWGETVIPFGIAGLTSGRTSQGHRWLGEAIEIKRPAEYAEDMAMAKVVVDHVQREKLIRADLDRLAGEQGLTWIDPGGKLEEVLFLNEWPTVAAGTFEGHHLSLPAEVLETAMQSHQRYFPLLDKRGKLSNTFLFVTNGDPECLDQIIAGNLRVLEGRIEDAEFSFDKDKATGLEQMISQLGKIVFHIKAGTMADKTERLVALTGYLADVTGAPGEAREHGLEAARLSKADQVSIMVREFADLEGVMGETYALMEGHHKEVAQAIREQFLPDAAGGVVPKTVPGALLATVEKVDNIVAGFACGEPPSGSKDPHGLRRAAAGMVAIAMEHGLRYDVQALLDKAYEQLEGFPGLVAREAVVADATEFVLERLAKALTDDGLARDTVDAVLPTSRDFLDIKARAQALQKCRAGKHWEDLVTLFTRPANLAKQLPPEAAADAVGKPDGGVDAKLFQVDAEKNLFAAYTQAVAKVTPAIEAGQYGDALAALAALRPAVDGYFDDVLVMAKEEPVKFNRLRQLSAIARLVRSVVALELVQA
jgi:glycyl-tRNA synthetase beta chain